MAPGSGIAAVVCLSMCLQVYGSGRWEGQGRIWGPRMMQAELSGPCWQEWVVEVWLLGSQKKTRALSEPGPFLSHSVEECDWIARGLRTQESLSSQALFLWWGQSQGARARTWHGYCWLLVFRLTVRANSKWSRKIRKCTICQGKAHEPA